MRSTKKSSVFFYVIGQWASSSNWLKQWTYLGQRIDSHPVLVYWDNGSSTMHGNLLSYRQSRLNHFRRGEYCGELKNNTHTDEHLFKVQSSTKL